MLIRGDARFLPLQDACVDCVVTSPPYFGLRDYGNPSQIGLEPSPNAYVAALVTVFREVRRVLKPSGTAWCNIGDSYAGSGKGGNPDEGKQATNRGSQSIGVLYGKTGETARIAAVTNVTRKTWEIGAKPKDLLMIPARVALALQADGWYLRSDIIWAKPNPMPESVTDRPTKAHEYLFLLTKNERYYYDAQAIAEPVSAAMLMEMDQGYQGLGLKDYESAGVQNPSSVKARIIANARAKHRQTDPQAAGHRIVDNVARARANGADHDSPFGPTRNKRTVWTIPTMPYAGAHFATMPEALVEPCILAGCPLGGLVCDPFVGSGTVVAVAERLGRRGVGVDLSYQDLAKERTAQRGIRFDLPA
jgi:DNA modification methylase